MNLFRKNDTELLDKIASYEVHIQNLESDLSNQALKIDELFNQVQVLIGTVKEQEEIVEVAETILEATEKELEEVKTELVAKDETIGEVMENAVSVSKQAAIQAAIILGEMGTPVVETVDAPEEVDIIQQIKSLKGKELIDFYNKNKPNIYTSVKPFLNK